MAVRFTTRQMLRLTTDLALLAAMPIIVLRIGGLWSVVAAEILLLAITGPGIYRNIKQLRRQQRAVQEERRRFIAEARAAKMRKV